MTKFTFKGFTLYLAVGFFLFFAFSCNTSTLPWDTCNSVLPSIFCDNVPKNMKKWYDGDTLSNGEIRLDARDSHANWDDFSPKTASNDTAPNILFILYDDTGLGAWSPYGGKIKMPTLDSLAADGVTYTQWHTTALCSPTRSTIMTGRNHHLNGMASITESADGFPGANGRVPDNCVPFAQVLKDNGYSTFWVGKNHNVPETDVAPGANRSEWPTQQGFDRFYGFLGGETNNWYPDLVEDNRFVEPPSEPIYGEEGEEHTDMQGKYHLSKDLANNALKMLRNQQASNPHKPWYMWFNPGANHAPHHSPLSYTQIYKDENTFRKGYNVYRKEILDSMISKGIIPEGPNGIDTTALNFLPEAIANEADQVIPWDDLTPRVRRLYVRMAEVYAGFSTYTDYHVGRIIDYLKETDQYDNTIILYAADNGASGEGTPYGSVNENKFFNGYPDDLDENIAAIPTLGTDATYNHFPTGWAAAFSTPFKMFKRYSQFAGGTNDSLVIAWPEKTKNLSGSRIRHQYHHSVDIVPTLLEAIGIDMPKIYNGVKQKPLSGVSMLYTLEDACAPDTRTQKEVQYYSMLGTRGIWKNGWKALELHAPTSGKGGYSVYPNTTNWELYHIDSIDSANNIMIPIDRAESNNLAQEYPQKLKELIDEWYKQAAINNVLPLDDRAAEELFAIERPNPEPPCNTNVCTYRYYPKTDAVPEGVAVNIRGRSYTIEAHVVKKTGKTPKGVLFAHGSRFGGHTMYINEVGILTYAYNFLGIETYSVALTNSVSSLADGEYVFTAEFEIDKEYPNSSEYDDKYPKYKGLLTLSAEAAGLVSAQDSIYTQPGKFTLSGDGLCVGYDSADAIIDYQGLGLNPKGEFEDGTIKYVEVTVSGEVDQEAEAKAEARRIMLRQ